MVVICPELPSYPSYSMRNQFKRGMLFRGVPSEDAESGIWQLARARVGEVDWPSVVGVKEDAQDKKRFRVLEWGAMEVL